jgi:hypothetical protein
MSANDEMTRQTNRANAERDVDRLQARVAELERERDRLREVCREQADVLASWFSDDTQLCRMDGVLTKDLSFVERALRAAVEE